MVFKSSLNNGGGSGGGGVTSLNSITGAVTLAAGTNITLTPVGQTITINATGGSGSQTPWISDIDSGGFNLDLTGSSNILANGNTFLTNGRQVLNSSNNYVADFEQSLLLIAGAGSQLDWQPRASNINGANYWFNASNQLVGDGSQLTGVYADRAIYLDGGGAFGTFGSTSSPDRWSPTAADQAISSFSQSTYFNDSGFYGNGSGITGVNIAPPGSDGDFLVNVSGAIGTVGVSWNYPNSTMMIAGSLNLNGYIVDAATNHSIDPNDRLLIASDNSTNMVDYTNASSNTSGAQVWFDSGNSNRLTTVDINLTGSLYTNGTRAVADGTYTVGLGISTNGTITIVGGIITAIQQAS